MKDSHYYSAVLKLMADGLTEKQAHEELRLRIQNIRIKNGMVSPDTDIVEITKDKETHKDFRKS